MYLYYLRIPKKISLFFLLIFILIFNSIPLNAKADIETTEKKLQTTEKKLQTTENDLKLVKNRLNSNLRTESFLTKNLIEMINVNVKNLNFCQNIFFKYSHVISLNNSVKIFSNINQKLDIIDVYPNPVMLETHLEDYSKVSLNVPDKNLIEFTLDKSLNDKTIVLPFVILMKIENDKKCLIELEISLGEEFKNNEKWELVNIFGRTGYGPGNFSLPYGTEFVDDLFFVTDCSNENISIFSKDSQFIKYFGKFGTDLGQLDTPADIKVTKNKVYVVEERNHRIQIFDRKGNPLSVFGSKVAARYNPELHLHKFNNPLGLALSSETIVVVDYGNNRILGYDLDFNNKWVLHNKLNTKADYNNPDPKNMIINFPYYAEYIPQRDQFIITNRGGHNMLLISNDGNIIKVFGGEVLKAPHEVAVSPKGDILVANMKRNSTVIFDANTEYDTYTEINFPLSYGLPKTVTSISENHFRTGFVRNGAAYFADIKKKENINLTKIFNEDQSLKLQRNYETISKKNLVSLLNKSKDNKDIHSLRLYSQYCASCHESGQYGAPQRGNIESWAKFTRDLDILTELAVNGKGAMISKGGCTECTRMDIYEIIKNVLVPMNW